MSNRESQRHLDQLALEYLAAVDAEEFDTIAALWEQAAGDAELDAMLHELNAELARERDERESAAAIATVLDAIELHLPSADVIGATGAPPTVAEVVERLLRHPPAGLTPEDLSLSDAMRTVTTVVPTELGISQVIAWGSQFGSASEAYWRAFRETALDLWMERASAENYRLAARPKRPKDKQ